MNGHENMFFKEKEMFTMKKENLPESSNFKLGIVDLTFMGQKMCQSIEHFLKLYFTTFELNRHFLQNISVFSFFSNT